MKTKKQVIEENPLFTKLIDSVIKLIGIDSVNDINSHGIDVGFNGFIYYSDTLKFTREYRNYIKKLLENDAESFGISIEEMVSNFGVFKNSPIDMEDKKDLYRFISGKTIEQSTISNVLAWYAAETVCRFFED